MRSFPGLFAMSKIKLARFWTGSLWELKLFEDETCWIVVGIIQGRLVKQETLRNVSENELIAWSAGKRVRPSRLVFSFASDWLRRRDKFSGPITEQNCVKPQRNPEFLSTLNWKLYLKLRFLYFQNTCRIVGFVSAMLRIQWLFSSLSVIIC